MSSAVFAAVFDQLKADATLKTLLGLRKDNDTDAKVFAPPVPENEDVPYITLERQPEIPSHHYGGVSTFTETRFRCEVHGRTMILAQGIEDAVRSSVDGVRVTGTLGCFVESLSDDLIDPQDGSSTGDHTIPLDIKVLHNRS